MTTKTPEQALQDYIDKLGEERGRFVKAVENDLYNLRMNAEIYEALFGTNKERVELLNAASGDTAYWIERTMFESLVLQVCRLTDPVVSIGKKKNITIKALPTLLSKGTDSDLEARVDTAEAASRFARDWRNRRIAHSDEEVRMERAKMDVASRAKLKEAIEAIASCIKRYARLELDTTLMTHTIRQYLGDEISFLTALFYGTRERERIRSLKKELLSRGEWREIESLEILPEWLTKRHEPKEELE